VTTKHSYAVSWREDGGLRHVGKLVFTPSAVTLDGRVASLEHAVRVLDWDRIRAASGERDDGRRLLVLALRPEGRIAIESLDRPGSLAELEHAICGRIDAGTPP